MSQDQGIAALKTGDFAAAARHFTAAAKAEPDNAVIHYNLAHALRHSGREGEAIIQATHALARDPGLRQAARLLSYLLGHLKLRNPCGLDPAGLAAAFNFIDVDHQILGPTALSYMKQCTTFSDALILGRASGWDAGARWLLSSRGRVVLRDPLLRTTLCAAANTDIDIEQLLTALRKVLLMAPPKDTFRKAHVLEFACVLARQSEINEYVFAVSNEELQRLGDIFINLQGLRDGSRAAAESLLLKALYAPLWRLLGDAGKDIDGRTLKPNTIGKLVSAHMEERRTNAEAARNIESIGVIGDEISRNVARLYENNPYPRWLSLHASTEKIRRDQLAHHFAENELTFMDAPYKVLIAGSGTGQQATDAALGYGPKAALTAIDISRSSLTYAKYMSDQFGVDNLRFIQCDILNAGLLDGTFDIIECIGVLHHMDDPWRGWKALARKLRPGGLMKIGLYSRAARRSIASLRDAIKARNLKDDEQTIRAYRQDILTQGDDGKAAFLHQSADFFTLSNFRDLVFHVAEQHVTIPEIVTFMTDNELAFHGFHIPPDIDDDYPDGEAMMNLESWRLFEDAHPDTFKGMYVFWCRRDN